MIRSIILDVIYTIIKRTVEDDVTNLNVYSSPCLVHDETTVIFNENGIVVHYCKAKGYVVIAGVTQEEMEEIMEKLQR